MTDKLPLPELPDGWPQPDAHAAQLSRKLVTVICDAIAEAGGWISFAEYMERVLYTPGLGYYSAGARKFGPGGDFVTAPEVSGLFSRCVARSCASVLEGLGAPVVMELGAGSGIMAADMLAEFERLGGLPEQYLILERSADLRQRQHATLAEKVPQLLPRVHWLDSLPEQGFEGVIVGNEVLDALPVERFSVTDGKIERLGVICRDGRPVAGPAAGIDERMVAALAELPRHVSTAALYTSELTPDLSAWLASLARLLKKGMMLWIDYGYPRAEYYHPQRNDGTLLCYYRHRAHDDPFLAPGLQDVTAHVDFTALAEAADAAGLAVSGFNAQAAFLLDAGLAEVLSSAVSGDNVADLRLSSEVKTLTLPGEMGERVKCMALGRGITGVPVGFRSQDLRGRL